MSFKAIFGEALLIGIAGAILAFGANSISRQGLKLNRNYFSGGALSHSAGEAAVTSSSDAAPKSLAERLRSEGLQLADSNLVSRLYADPNRESGLVAFVDARNDEHYQAGHVPGAYQLDHYHPERYLEAVLPACQVAQQILVYCKGGACEDSEQTALFLRDAGVPSARLFVYAGGFDEWSSNRWPVEIGERNSGQIHESQPAGHPGAK
ncbi:MAG TPA: rhodanese-like domain-containing protein [Verrucomicrobiae bacterium]|nr:rhodanese-like domain-containing protein [Verrucomicrobiae bacterium]